jgi:hypothetical protein
LIHLFAIENGRSDHLVNTSKNIFADPEQDQSKPWQTIAKSRSDSGGTRFKDPQSRVVCCYILNVTLRFLDGGRENRTRRGLATQTPPFLCLLHISFGLVVNSAKTDAAAFESDYKQRIELCQPVITRDPRK